MGGSRCWSKNVEGFQGRNVHQSVYQCPSNRITMNTDWETFKTCLWSKGVSSGFSSSFAVTIEWCPAPWFECLYVERILPVLVQTYWFFVRLNQNCVNYEWFLRQNGRMQAVKDGLKWFIECTPISSSAACNVSDSICIYCRNIFARSSSPRSTHLRRRLCTFCVSCASSQKFKIRYVNCTVQLNSSKQMNLTNGSNWSWVNLPVHLFEILSRGQISDESWSPFGHETILVTKFDLYFLLHVDDSSNQQNVQSIKQVACWWF